MKNEALITEADKIAKAFNQIANAIGNLNKVISKSEKKDFKEGGRVSKTKPFCGMPIIDWLSGKYEGGLYKKFYEVYHAPSASFMAATFVQDEKVIEESIKAFDEAVKKYSYDDEFKKENINPFLNYKCIWNKRVGSIRN